MNGATAVAMDVNAVIAKALILGCRMEDDGRGPHQKLVTPSGKAIPISRGSSKEKGQSDRCFQLMKRLREGGVDVKRSRSAGPARRINGDSLLCKERRCANLGCPRNAIALEELPASGKAFATFRTASCGFIQTVGCGLVIRTGEEPALCALPSKHDGECAPAQPKEAHVAPSQTDPAPAPESASSPEKQRKRRVYVSAAQRAVAVARVRRGERQLDIAKELNVSRAAVSSWVNSAGPAPTELPALPAPVPPPMPTPVTNGAHMVTLPAPAQPAQTLFAVDPPMLAVVQVGEETYDLAIPASELVKLVLKYRVNP